MNAKVVAFGGNFSTYFMGELYKVFTAYFGVLMAFTPVVYTILVNFVNSADQVAESCVLFSRFQGVVERRPFTL